MTESELIEQLADKEHASWARWMEYLFSKCEPLSDGSLVIPFPYVVRWRRQTETPYVGLSDNEQQSDRNEVAHILPIIKEYAHAAPTHPTGSFYGYPWGEPNDG